MISAEYPEWLRDTLGIPDSFLERLLTDDDWTFIIKLHAMIEGALNHVIPRFFDNSGLHKIIARLETSNPKTGKVAFAKACGLLPANAIKFIQYLSELRNLCAHEPKNFLFNIGNIVGNMTEEQKASWLEKVDFEVKYPLILKGEKGDRRKAYLRHPRLALHKGTEIIMRYLHCEEIKIEKELLEEVVDFLEQKPTRLRPKAGLHTPPTPKTKE